MGAIWEDDSDEPDDEPKKPKITQKLREEMERSLQLRAESQKAAIVIWESEVKLSGK